MECKSTLNCVKGIASPELIDTLWNVNELMGWEENATVEN